MLKRVLQTFVMALGIFLSPLPSFASDQWIQTYFDCFCFTGKAEECLSDLQARNRLQPFAIPPQGQPVLALADKEISTMNTALIILESQEQWARSETQACLDPKRMDIKNAIHYALNERTHLRPGVRKNEEKLNAQSYAIISALAQLAKQIYSRAYGECMTPTNAAQPAQKYEMFLPDPLQCQAKNTASKD